MAAVDSKGDRVWVRGFDGTVQHPNPIREEGSGSVRMVFANVTRDEENRLVALTTESGRDLWSRTANFDAEGTATGPFFYTETLLMDWGASETVVARLHAGRWYHCALQSLRPESGEILGTYYHPGHLHYGPTVASPEAGTRMLLAYGSNSSARFVPELVPFETERHCGAVVLLGENDFFGQAYPYSRAVDRDDWPEAPTAREHSYLCIAPFAPDPDATVADVSVHRTSEGLAASIEVRLADGRIVRTDGDLFPTSVYLVLDQQAEIASRDQEVVSTFVFIRDGREVLLTLETVLVATAADVPAISVG
ncbi:MAG: hypothetical protein KDA27_26145 [Candidatus Eisenbacteria bacterium]|uniref:Uncharacterized protein n=1 Tax=Eiseniibacteriota bacterium TaxID=2212470 RepID=A0A956NIP5_UNCEI|nr:hypothetical protein [Candidatus Eisenbacteria bacterium]